MNMSRVSFLMIALVVAWPIGTLALPLESISPNRGSGGRWSSDCANSGGR